MRKLSNKGKKNFKKILYVGLYIVIISWMVVSGVQLWLNCAILDSNYSNALTDIKDGSIVEVTDVYDNGDFILSGRSNLLKADDSIDNYVRLPHYCKYYYNESTKSFFAPLTQVETRSLIIKFLLLDILSLVIMIILLVYNRDSNIWLRTLIWLLEIIYAFSTYLVYANAFDVLYGVTANVWIIPLAKLSLLCVVILIVFIIDARREMKLPIKLQRRGN